MIVRGIIPGQSTTWSLFSIIYRINVVKSIRYTYVKDYLMVMHVVCRRPNVAHPIENDESDTIHVDGRERYRQIPLVRTSFFVRRMCFEKWKLRFAPLISCKLVEVSGDEGKRKRRQASQCVYLFIYFTPSSGGAKRTVYSASAECMRTFWQTVYRLAK